MTDEELVARLRDAKRDWPEFGHDRAEAADRIDTCAAEREKLEAAEAKLAECEARLRKAVEALRGSRETILQLVNSRGSEAEGTDEDWVGDIDTTLAAVSETHKIKSSKAATPYGLEGENHD